MFRLFKKDYSDLGNQIFELMSRKDKWELNEIPPASRPLFIPASLKHENGLKIISISNNPACPRYIALSSDNVKWSTLTLTIDDHERLYKTALELHAELSNKPIINLIKRSLKSNS